MTSSFFAFIDTLNLSKGWKVLFKKIHVVYHDNYANGKHIDTHLWRKSADFRRLTLNFQSYFTVNINLFAFLFGPFYYLAKGMLIKGGILFAIFLPLFFSNLKFLLIPLFLYCGYFANRDYFSYQILKNKKSGYNVMLLNDMPDRAFIHEITSKPRNFIPLILTVTIICSIFARSIYSSIAENYLLEEKLNTIPVICSGKDDCQRYILTAIKEVSQVKAKEDISKKYFLIAVAYLKINNLYNAINALNLALDIDGENINALYLRADLFYKDKRYSQALLDYKDLLKKSPRAYFVNFYIGRCFYQLGMYNYAASSFKDAAKKKKEPSYYEYWGYAELKNNNKENAIKVLKQAVRLYSQTNNKEKVKSLEKYIKTLN